MQELFSDGIRGMNVSECKLQMKLNNVMHISGMGTKKEDTLYLNMPMVRKRLSTDTFNILTDKINTRINSWKAKALSYSGQLTFIRSTLQ
ncbi:hypothetical protein Ancab_036415, partial [Ancistrocladus abbreviatus]